MNACYHILHTRLSRHQIPFFKETINNISLFKICDFYGDQGGNVHVDQQEAGKDSDTSGRKGAGCTGLGCYS